MADRRARRKVEQVSPPLAPVNSVGARLAVADNPSNDGMIWMALMGCRLGTDDVHLDAILAEHKRCPRGYCKHRQAVDRYSEAIGWDAE